MDDVHLFIDADRPGHPLALPKGVQFEVVRTTVEVVKRGRTVVFDETVFRHYVKITRRANGNIRPGTISHSSSSATPPPGPAGSSTGHPPPPPPPPVEVTRTRWAK